MKSQEREIPVEKSDAHVTLQCIETLKHVQELVNVILSPKPNYKSHKQA